MIAHTVNSNDNMGRHRFNKDPFEERDHRLQWKLHRGNWKAFFVAALMVLNETGEGERFQARAEVPVQLLPAENQWRVWLEPKSTHAPVSAPIPGAQETELVAGIHSDAPVRDVSISKEGFEALRIGWDQFLKRARANADALELKPRYFRDRKKVIEYAVLSSKQPIMNSAVLGTKFLDLFKETLGEKVLLVVPNRYTAFVFPALASSYEQYARVVLEAYKTTAFPVSVEVFEVSAQGWKTVGIYEP
ncbi:MAG: hypothetical protein JWL90_4474 [Chthoniobacteraceae bacterium]|nr:hypothetical protein [Chthoniobacteraceae bacterium]